MRESDQEFGGQLPETGLSETSPNLPEMRVVSMGRRNTQLRPHSMKTKAKSAG
jgi:hypothetical protein